MTMNATDFPTSGLGRTAGACKTCVVAPSSCKGRSRPCAQQDWVGEDCRGCQFRAVSRRQERIRLYLGGDAATVRWISGAAVRMIPASSLAPLVSSGSKCGWTPIIPCGPQPGIPQDCPSCGPR